LLFLFNIKLNRAENYRVKIFSGLDNYVNVVKSVVTVGTFDGVHAGHRKVFKTLVSKARSIGGKSVAITFAEHPRVVLNKDVENLRFLNSIKEKTELLEQMNLDQLIIIPFSKEFAGLSASDFIRQYVVDVIGAGALIVGYDHRIGKGREAGYGDIERAAEQLGIEVVLVEPSLYEGEPVSSTRIRNLLLQGHIEQANECLGYNYAIDGKVVSGNKIGESIGFPTANILPDNNFKLIPYVGVYAVYVEVQNKKFWGMMNIGYRPTLNDNNKLHVVIEVNIIDFNSNIYNESIKVSLVARIRDEIKFDGLDSLKKQLIADRRKTIEILSGQLT